MNTRPATIDDLEGWVLSGGHCRVVEIASEHVVVDLCACTGEPMERIEADDPAVITYLRNTHSELGPS